MAQAEEGEWISTYDIVSKDGVVTMEAKGVPGKCKRECATIALSCSELFDQVDDLRDQISLLLWKGTSLDVLTEKLCEELSEACPAKRAKGERKFDEEFMAKTQKEIEMDKLMAKMQDMPGMGG